MVTGGIVLHSVEGNRQRLDGGAMFGNVPRALWARWIPPDGGHRIPLACRGLLAVGLAGQSVLFETGIGVPFPPALCERYGIEEPRHVLLESLAALGHPAETIDVVVLSHLHFDHAGGLLAPWQAGVAPTLAFPRARVLVSEVAWARARTPHLRDRASFLPEIPPLLERSGRLELVQGPQARALGDAVRFHFSDGHTPGLMLAEIGGAPGGVIFCGDLIPGLPWVHLPVTMGYDRAPELLVDEKARLLAHARASGQRLFFTHDPQHALASPAQDERGRWHATDALASVDGLALGE